MKAKTAISIIILLVLGVCVVLDVFKPMLGYCFNVGYLLLIAPACVSVIVDGDLSLEKRENGNG